jgi:predicted ABC-type ATPase
MPNVVILAGPNGAGKSTVAEHVLRDLPPGTTFINDEILARDSDGSEIRPMSVPAWQRKLRLLQALVARQENTAFETTLAGYDFAPWLRELFMQGYRVELVYVWVSDVETCARRVRQRAQAGGQAVSEDTVRHQHGESARNFFGSYQALANVWRVFDNSTDDMPSIVAEGRGSTVTVIHDQDIWDRFRRSTGYAHDS